MRLILSSIVVFTVALSILSASVYAQQNEVTIPAWVKGVANFWAEDNISDSEYAESLTFLIQQGIIKIDSEAMPQASQISLADEEKRLYELELDQKDDKINILENDLEDTGLDNSKLLQNIVEKDQEIEHLQDALTASDEKFENWKKDNPVKTGNIGGKMINAETIKEMEDEIDKLKQTNAELEEEIRELKSK